LGASSISFANWTTNTYRVPGKWCPMQHPCAPRQNRELILISMLNICTYKMFPYGWFCPIWSRAHTSKPCPTSDWPFPSLEVCAQMGSDGFIGLTRKCIFQFSRKCENHAKMGRFSRNFVSRKSLENFAEIFWKTKNLLHFTVIRHAWYMWCNFFAITSHFTRIKRYMWGTVMLEFRCH
jgi:hypothetical protein